jgi:hypothetical protein
MFLLLLGRDNRGMMMRKQMRLMIMSKMRREHLLLLLW